jgi:fructosamine-3-kinase
MISEELVVELGLDLDPRSAHPVSGGDTATVMRYTSPDGPVLVKASRRPAPGMFRAEASGLQWLAAGGLPTPAVLAVSEQALALEWLEAESPSKAAAQEFGAALAGLHSRPVAAFGESPTAADGQQPPNGWLGAVPISYGEWSDWPRFYTRARLLPTAELAHQVGGLSQQGLDQVSHLCDLLAAGSIDTGTEQPPVRIHGDLWAGNLLWRDSKVAVIDPAAHGGHPETDLGMLLLFPPTHLDDILASYRDTRHLDNSWEQRVPLHQLLPLLIHAVMFGSGYGHQVERAVRQVLGTLIR